MKKLLLASAMLVAVAASAHADPVTFDPETGVGNTNLGTIVSSFGPAVKESPEAVTFVLVQPLTYRTECRKRPLLPKVVETFERVRRERTDIGVEVETNPEGKPVGFTLTGKEVTVLAGRFCPRGWIVVRGTTPELIASGPRRLTAFFEDQKNTIWSE